MDKIYEVVDTREHTSMTPTGGTRKRYEVWIETNKGVRGSTFIDPDDWKPESIHEILTEKAQELNLAFEV